VRIRIIFGLKNRGAILPFHHQKHIRSMIREVLGDAYLSDGSLMFNYSGLKGQTKVGREGLHYFSRRVTLVISSINSEFINYFINKLFDFEHIFLGDLLLEPEYVEREVLEKPLGESVRYLCLSPIVLLNSEENEKNKSFIFPTSDAFSDYLYESTMLRMEQSGEYTPETISTFYKFQIIPDKDYLNRIQKQEKKFARIYTTLIDGKIREVRGYTFPFKLYAAKEVQHFLYHCGFGELCHNGFGMLDLANSSAVSKEVIFERQLKNQSQKA